MPHQVFQPVHADVALHLAARLVQTQHEVVCRHEAGHFGAVVQEQLHKIGAVVDERPHEVLVEVDDAGFAVVQALQRLPCHVQAPPVHRLPQLVAHQFVPLARFHCPPRDLGAGLLVRHVVGQLSANGLGRLLVLPAQLVQAAAVEDGLQRMEVKLGGFEGAAQRDA